MSDSHVSVDSSQDLTGITISSISSGSSSGPTERVDAMSAVLAQTPIRNAGPKMHSIDDDDDDDLSEDPDISIERDLDVLQSMLDYQRQKEMMAKAKTTLIAAQVEAAKKRNESSMMSNKEASPSDKSSKESDSIWSFPRGSILDSNSSKSSPEKEVPMTPKYVHESTPASGTAREGRPRQAETKPPKWKPTLGEPKKSSGKETPGVRVREDTALGESHLSQDSLDRNLSRIIDEDMAEENRKRSMADRSLQESMNLNLKKEAKRTSTPERKRAQETPVPVTPPTVRATNEKNQEAFRT